MVRQPAPIGGQGGSGFVERAGHQRDGGVVLPGPDAEDVSSPLSIGGSAGPEYQPLAIRTPLGFGEGLLVIVEELGRSGPVRPLRPHIQIPIPGG